MFCNGTLSMSPKIISSGMDCSTKGVDTTSSSSDLICISLLLSRSTPGNRVKLSVVLCCVFLNRNMFPQIKRHLTGSHLQDYEGEIISFI